VFLTRKPELRAEFALEHKTKTKKDNAKKKPRNIFVAKLNKNNIYPKIQIPITENRNVEGE
jgi:hypothetical protein